LGAILNHETERCTARSCMEVELHGKSLPFSYVEKKSTSNAMSTSE
jgi:hypothetical protein